MQIPLSSIANGQGGLKLLGETPAAYAGAGVTGLGDVNGDGFDDVLIGAWGQTDDHPYQGAAYVVYGGFTVTAPISLATVAGGDIGFKIVGAQDYDQAGAAVAAAGDINGDGLADLLIGAPNLAGGSGGAYVVYGSGSQSEPVHLADLAGGQAGYPLHLSSFAYESAGLVLSAAGDVNGDGRGDLVVGSYGGNAYVVFGSDTPPSEVSLQEIVLGHGGFVVGAESGYLNWPGMDVAGAGDVNGDGLDDLALGVWGDGRIDWDSESSWFSGATYVVFGKTDGAPLRYDDLAGGNGGFRILGEQVADGVMAVAAAGDVNGDGFADMLIGAFGNDQGGAEAGAAYVVYGGPAFAATVDLRDVALGQGGFKIIGEAANNFASSVSAAGDVNGDGLGDLLIGAFGNANSAGAAYVIFGNPTPFETVWLKDIAAGAGGVKLVGDVPGERAGIDVAGAGDVNGDGFDDVLIGAVGNGSAGAYAGAAYVVYGGPTSTVIGDDWQNVLAGTSTADRLFGLAGEDRLIAGAGNDQVEGNDDNDRLFGNGGNDLLAGGEGKDTLHGQLGDDTLDGGSGYDAAAFGTSTRGVVVDLAAGIADGDGHDVLRGIEEVFGSRSADVISGDDGDNWFTGSAGDDTLDGRGGRDTASYADAAESISADLSTGVATGDGTDRLIGMENVVGSDLADTLTGDAVANRLTGNGGGDQLFARGGNDALLGGAGDDRLDGGAGHDWLSGGAGADVFRFVPETGATNDVDRVIDFAPGEDKIDLIAFAFDSFDRIAELMHQDGDRIIISLDQLGGPSIVVEHLAIADLHAADVLL